MNQTAVIDNPTKRIFRKSISVVTTNGIHVIRIDDIMHIEADRSYSFIYTSRGKRVLVSKPLKDFESVLPREDFARVHASHLINIHHIDYYNQEEGGRIHFTNGDSVPVARRRKQEFFSKLNFV